MSHLTSEWKVEMYLNCSYGISVQETRLLPTHPPLQISPLSKYYIMVEGVDCEQGRDWESDYHGALRTRQDLGCLGVLSVQRGPGEGPRCHPMTSVRWLVGGGVSGEGGHRDEMATCWLEGQPEMGKPVLPGNAGNAGNAGYLQVDSDTLS